MTPEQFCSLYLELCTGANRDARHMPGNCVASYTADRATAMTSPNMSIGACESYHLCNVYNNTVPTATAAAIMAHCTHASGTAICVP